MSFDKYEKAGAYHWRQADVSTPWSFNAVVQARYKFAIGLIPPDAKRVLDIGCGDGFLMHCLARRGAAVWGVEPESVAVLLARNQHKKSSPLYSIAPEVIQGTGLHLPFQERSFDYGVMTEVLEHVEKPELLIAELKRVMLPGGQVVISTPNWKEGKPYERYHYKEYTAQELSMMLQASFRSVRIIGLGDARLKNTYQRLLALGRIGRIPFWALSRLRLNPFQYWSSPPSRNSLLLFAVCET